MTDTRETVKGRARTSWCPRDLLRRRRTGAPMEDPPSAQAPPEWTEPMPVVKPVAPEPVGTEEALPGQSDLGMDWGRRPEVLAEILADGTVQVLDRAGAFEEQTQWGRGTVSG